MVTVVLSGVMGMFALRRGLNVVVWSLITFMILAMSVFFPMSNLLGFGIGVVIVFCLIVWRVSTVEDA